MIKLIPLLIIALLIYIALRQYKALPREKKKPFLIKIFVYATIAVLVVAVISGRIHWLGGVLAALLAFIKIGFSSALRFLPIFRFLQRNEVLKNPIFRTEQLEIQLDLKSGVISGKVLAGENAGKSLDSLSEAELDVLESALKDSKRAYYLLKVFRQQHKKDSSFKGDVPSVSDPSIDEARLMLGLPDTFDKKDIETAYKKLMQKIHPDRGGNDYLASRVNRARDILIQHIKQK